MYSNTFDFSYFPFCLKNEQVHKGFVHIRNGNIKGDFLGLE